MNDNGALCALPWVHLNCNPDGSVTLCCQSGYHLFDDQGLPLNIQTHSLQEIWSSQAYRDIRRDMLAGKKLPHCEGCYRNESHGWGSARLGMNSLWLDTAEAAARPDARVLDRAALSEDAGPPRYFDLRIGNICNLKCVNCRSIYSSQIERDPVHSRWSDMSFVRLPHRFSTAEEWYASDDLLAEIIEFGADAQEIQLAGGEPTINKVLITWIEHLCATGKARDIDISLVTNLTNVSPHLHGMLAQFRRVTLKISLDGYGDCYEYVRFPGKWKTIERNIGKVLNLQNIHEAIIFPVLNVYNMLRMTELLEWAEDRGLPVVAGLVRSVDYVDCRLLPPQARKEAKRRFDAFFEARTIDGVLLPRLVNLAHEIDLAFGELDATDFDASTRHRHLARFMQFTNDMDASRGTGFAATFPETLAFMTDAYGPWISTRRFALPSKQEATQATIPNMSWQDWAQDWSLRSRVPIAAGFAEAILGAGQAIIDRNAATIVADWRNERPDRAVAQLASLFETFTPAGTAWLRENSIDLQSSDGTLRVRYFVLRLLIDRIQSCGFSLDEAARLIDAYLDSVPQSRAARLVLAELLFDAGHVEPALAAVKLVLTEHSILLLPQQVLVAMLAPSRSDDAGPVIDGAFTGDLSGHFCPIPFDEMMTDSEGYAWTCCPSFLPVPIGKIHESSWDDIWSSNVARTLRESVLDGSFKYCSRTQCPHILSGSLPRRDEVTDPRHRRIIDTGDFADATPRKFYFCHDATCNLACPQCRTEMYKIKPEKAAQLERLLTTLVDPILDHAGTNSCTILLSGNGDPFSSEHYLEILRRLDPDKHKGVTLHLVTNGLLFRHYWNELPNIHPFLINGYVGVSLDGASPEVYAQTRGAKWYKALENLEFLSELRRSGKIGGVGINYAVQECNFRDMSVVVELATRLGIDTVGFNQLRNEGTYSSEDYRRRAVFETDHPRYEEFLDELRQPILANGVATFGSLTIHVERARSQGRCDGASFLSPAL
jgi:MoaA/NifB/PqqE/SkfB family radical SAM enzyme